MIDMPLGLTYDDVLLVPKRSSLNSRKQANTSTYLTSKIKLKIPLVSANMDTITESKMAIELAKAGGIGIIHRFVPIDYQADEIKKVKKAENYPVGAAVGVREEYLKRTKALINKGCDVIVVDIAHGHSDHTLECVVRIRKKYKKVQIIAGNVATRKGTKDLINAGVDAVKVGVGPGSLCTTRIVAGAGVPQLTAVLNCAEVAKEYNIPIVADGGIRTSGDIVKALAAGAATVMIGGLFAGCRESPGIEIFKNGCKYKITRGMASLRANIDRAAKENKDDFGYKEYVSEGVEAIVPYRGKVADIIQQLVGGLQSGMSYSGAKSVKELQRKAEFIRITNAGLIESKPHDINEI